MQRQLLTALTDQGRASGLEAAADVLIAMASHKRRVVGTGELRMAAEVLRENAAKLRAGADAVIAHAKKSTGTP